MSHNTTTEVTGVLKRMRLRSCLASGRRQLRSSTDVFEMSRVDSQGRPPTSTLENGGHWDGVDGKEDEGLEIGVKKVNEASL